MSPSDAAPSPSDGLSACGPAKNSRPAPSIAQPQQSADLPSVSVVVPVYNEELVLQDCLQALQAQLYDGDYEIIVVANACTDSSPEIARAMGVRVVEEPKKGVVFATRAGIAAARGEIIACTDADTLVPPNWVARIAQDLAKPGVVAVTGPFVYHDSPFWLRWGGLIVANLNYKFLIGMNLAVWRWAYDQVGGFDPRYNLGADGELGVRLSKIGKVLIDRRLKVYSSGRRYMVDFWRTIYRYAVTIFSLMLFGKPYFYDFSDIRARFPSRLFKQESYRIWFSGAALRQVRCGQPVVALTFDDGPSHYTAQVLDILRDEGVPASFFVIGRNVERLPELARRIVSEGHAIGHHTYSHGSWIRIDSDRQLRRELDLGAQAIKAATGVTPTLMRPPRGLWNPVMIALARQQGYQPVAWSVAARDWQRPSAEIIADRVLRKAVPGSIILLHDGQDTQLDPSMQNTVDSLPTIIRTLKQRGYRFVTVPQLMQLGRLAQGDDTAGPDG